MFKKRYLLYTIAVILVLWVGGYCVPAYFSQEASLDDGTTITAKPAFWEYVPMLTGRANTIYPHIWLRRDIFNDLKGTEPDPQSEATLIHEKVHLARQGEVGFLEYLLKYFLSREFRFDEEILAIKPQIQFLRSHGVEFDIEDRARRLSSAEYLWAASYKKAFETLSEI